MQEVKVDIADLAMVGDHVLRQGDFKRTDTYWSAEFLGVPIEVRYQPKFDVWRIDGARWLIEFRFRPIDARLATDVETRSDRGELRDDETDLCKFGHWGRADDTLFYGAPEEYYRDMTMLKTMVTRKKKCERTRILPFEIVSSNIEDA
jgi:hypothetical protein